MIRKVHDTSPREISAADFLPAGRLTLPKLVEAAAHCRGCDLYRNATQTVFGAGPRAAQVMLVGEQPGDAEDKAGEPFVGPAGRLLDKALEAAGVDRSTTYVTNAVKHFKWTARGKRRIHGKPNAREIAACRPWLESELAVVKPQVMVALGATAAQALYGQQFRVTKQRGQIFESEWAPQSMATMHPSAILRMDSADREAGFAELVSDLKEVGKVLKQD